MTLGTTPLPTRKARPLSWMTRQNHQRRPIWEWGGGGDPTLAVGRLGEGGRCHTAIPFTVMINSMSLRLTLSWSPSERSTSGPSNENHHGKQIFIHNPEDYKYRIMISS